MICGLPLDACGFIIKCADFVIICLFALQRAMEFFEYDDKKNRGFLSFPTIAYVTWNKKALGCLYHCINLTEEKLRTSKKYFTFKENIWMHNTFVCMNLITNWGYIRIVSGMVEGVKIMVQIH